MSVESGEIVMFKKWDLDQNQQLSISPSLPSARDHFAIFLFFCGARKSLCQIFPNHWYLMVSSLPHHGSLLTILCSSLFFFPLTIASFLAGITQVRQLKHQSKGRVITEPVNTRVHTIRTTAMYVARIHALGVRLWISLSCLCGCRPG